MAPTQLLLERALLDNLVLLVACRRAAASFLLQDRLLLPTGSSRLRYDLVDNLHFWNAATLVVQEAVTLDI